MLEYCVVLDFLALSIMHIPETWFLVSSVHRSSTLILWIVLTIKSRKQSAFARSRLKKREDNIVFPLVTFIVMRIPKARHTTIVSVESADILMIFFTLPAIQISHSIPCGHWRW